MTWLDPSTWSTILKEASENGDIKVVPHQLQVGYESWTYSELTYIDGTKDY